MTSSQDFLPIEDIKNDLVFLKNGSVSLVLSISAVNFGLLFDTEQISLIQSFAGLLNSLSFPIQIVIVSRRLDVSSYLLTLDRAIPHQINPLLKEMAAHHRRFVASIIKANNVLDKQFYVCLNVSPLELGVLPKNIQERGKRAVMILSPRKDHLVRQLGRLGLKSRQLANVDLVKLFYTIYNPPYTESSEKLDISGEKLNNEAGSEKMENQNSNFQPQNPASNIQNPTLVSAPPSLPPQPIPQAVPPTAVPKVTPISTPLSPPFVVEELNDDTGT